MTRIEIFEPSPELYDEIERLGALHKDEVEAECKARGAQLMVWHAPIGGAFGRILKTRANPIYTQFFKEL